MNKNSPGRGSMYAKPGAEAGNKSEEQRLADREKYNKAKEERKLAEEPRKVARRERIAEIRKQGRELGW